IGVGLCKAEERSLPPNEIDHQCGLRLSYGEKMSIGEIYGTKLRTFGTGGDDIDKLWRRGMGYCGTNCDGEQGEPDSWLRREPGPEGRSLGGKQFRSHDVSFAELGFCARCSWKH